MRARRPRVRSGGKLESRLCAPFAGAGVAVTRVFCCAGLAPNAGLESGRGLEVRAQHFLATPAPVAKTFLFACLLLQRSSHVVNGDSKPRTVGRL